MTAAAAMCAVALGAGPALAASTAWRTANECAVLKVGTCADIATIAGATKVTADDGTCAGQVGVSVKWRNGEISQATFANTSVTVTGKDFAQYKVWH